MLEISKIKPGTKIEIGDNPYEVLQRVFSKTGRQGAVLRTKLKNIKNGSVTEVTFRDSDKLSEPILSRSKAQFLYCDCDLYYFMNQENYEQFSLPRNILGNTANFLIEEGISMAEGI